jgi:hypothetical protein
VSLADFAMVNRLPDGRVLVMVRGDDAGGVTSYHGRPFPPDEALDLARQIVDAASATPRVES